MAKGCEDGHVGNGVNPATLVNRDKTGSKLVYYYYYIPNLKLVIVQVPRPLSSRSMMTEKKYPNNGFTVNIGKLSYFYTKDTSELIENDRYKVK